MTVAGYDGVTVQAALDMQTGVVLDPMAEFMALGQHPNQGDTPAVGVAGLTLSVKQGNGKPTYSPACTDTDAVGMACERVTGLQLYSLWAATMNPRPNTRVMPPSLRACTMFLMYVRYSVASKRADVNICCQHHIKSSGHHWPHDVMV